MAAKERLADVVARHAPILHIHPKDAFMPSTVEWFMHHSELRVANKGGKEGTFYSIIPRGEVNAQFLARAAARHGDSSLLQLNLDEAGRPGFPKDLIDDVPLYVNVKEVCRADGSVEALELNYMTFYAHNGSYWIAGMRLGAHDGDWEHLTVRVHPETGDLVGVYFHAHRNHDGCWVDAAHLQRTPGGRPVAYVALHGHGTYPVSGKILRALFMVNDRCSSDGLLWQPRRCVLLPNLPHLTPEELREGGSGRPLMRVWSRGCTISGFESPPVNFDRLANDQSGEPEGDAGAGCAQVFTGNPSLMEGTRRAASAGTPDSDTGGGAEQPELARVEAAQKLPDSCLTPEAPPPSKGEREGVDVPSSTGHESGSNSASQLADDGDESVLLGGENSPTDHLQLDGPRGSEVGSLTQAFSEALSDVASEAADQGGVGPEASTAAELASVGDSSTGNDGTPEIPPDPVEEVVKDAAEAPPEPVVEVVEDSAEWLSYLGQWGTTPSPATQRWFLNAEPAVSRTVLQRVLHFPSERVADGKPRVPAKRS